MKRVADWLARLILGGAFAFAASVKLLDPAAFASDIGHYRLPPYPLTLALAVYLPWLELFAAAAVLCRRLERGALLVLFGLCVIFSGALASAWWRGLDISCGCFGTGSAAGVPLALFRSITLALLASYLLRRPANSAAVRPDIALRSPL